ncbi:MAG TPA: hypothetical protein VJT33_07925 [bacterium]|nr:hypothetical protein [bacterium]
MSRADRVRAAHRKEITLGEGDSVRSYVIRKVTNRDYLEEGVLNILLDTTKEPDDRQAAIRTFYQQHTSSLVTIEDNLLRKAVVDPPITDDGAGDSITLADLGDDRLALLDAIAEFSGFGPSAAAETKKSEDADLVGAVRAADGGPV